jgi:hypothetical protein
MISMMSARSWSGSLVEQCLGYQDLRSGQPGGEVHRDIAGVAVRAPVGNGAEVDDAVSGRRVGQEVAVALIGDLPRGIGRYHRGTFDQIER